MNNFFRNKTALGGKDPKKVNVRKETVYLPKVQSLKSSTTHQPRTAQQAVAGASKPPPRRFQLSPTSASPALKKEPDLQRQALRAPAVRGIKRKSATPQPERPLFSDDDDDDSSGSASDSDFSRKRMKSSVSSIESFGPQRTIVLQDGAVVKRDEFVNSADLTSGVYGDKYQNPWNDEQYVTAELQYPSKSETEMFELKWPRQGQGSDEYKPFDDMKETIKYVVTNYFPDDIRSGYLDDSSGIERRLNRAWLRQDAADWVSITDEYNEIVKKLVADGSVYKEIAQIRKLDLELVKRILDQIYSRTVSLKVEKLKAYTFGTDNVYGELLPRFVREIFERTQLAHNHTFVDLGSGVGNVTLQAALDVGCESWGIEMMKTPCELAELQAKEFAARSRLWGLSTGDVHLIEGDFTNNVQIGEVLKRADLVLVNNQAFTSSLNEKLIAMFLDLKEGAKVVSLKPFVPDGHRITARNIQSPANQFVQRRFEWFPDYVSWGGNGGHWYLATKDTRPLREYSRRHGSG